MSHVCGPSWPLPINWFISTSISFHWRCLTRTASISWALLSRILRVSIPTTSNWKRTPAGKSIRVYSIVTCWGYASLAVVSHTRTVSVIWGYGGLFVREFFLPATYLAFGADAGIRKEYRKPTLFLQYGSNTKCRADRNKNSGTSNIKAAGTLNDVHYSVRETACARAAESRSITVELTRIIYKLCFYKSTLQVLRGFLQVYHHDP